VQILAFSKNLTLEPIWVGHGCFSKKIFLHCQKCHLTLVYTYVSINSWVVAFTFINQSFSGSILQSVKFLDLTTGFSIRKSKKNPCRRVVKILYDNFYREDLKAFFVKINFWLISLIFPQPIINILYHNLIFLLITALAMNKAYQKLILIFGFRWQVPLNHQLKCKSS
jgi:hypothetical protein